MSKLQIVLGLVLAAFAFESGYAVYQYGYVGFFQEVLSSYAASVVALDLVIALSLVTAWMWSDARERGASFWPFALLTVALGSVGPLLYLIRRESWKRQESVEERPVRRAQPA